jgi:hypothetical protein
VYQPDGTRESDARRLAEGVAGADPVLSDLEPVFGARLLAQNLAGFSGGLGYRRSLLAGKTSFERAAAEVRYGRGRGLNAYAGADYDLVAERLAQVRLEVRYDGPVFAASVEGRRVSPVLAADSIWTYFATAPRDELALRADVYPEGPLRYYLRGTVSHYNTAINSSLDLSQAVDPSFLAGLTYGGSAGASYRRGALRSALDVTYRRGFQGRQLWVDLTAGYVPEGKRYTLDARLSVANVADAFNPLLRGNFYGLQGWASYALSRAARASLVLEGNSNPLTVFEAKAFALIDLKADL